MIHDDTAPSTDPTLTSTGADPLMDDVDAVYEAFLPHLVASRRSYVRRRLAAALLLPTLAIVAVAVTSTDDAPAQVATETDVEEGTVGLADEPEDQRAEKDVDPDDAQPEQVTLKEIEQQETRDEAPAWESVALGFVGKAKVALVDGELVLGGLDLASGWEGTVLALGSPDTLIVQLGNGELMLLATVSSDLEVQIVDFTPEPEPEVQTRKEIAVGDVGKVVVERDGETLRLTVTWSHEWWKAGVGTGQGTRVDATFANDGVTKHVEAWIDGTEIAHKVWVTEPQPEKDQKTDEDTQKKDGTDEESEIQTRKKIAVGDVGKVVVERDGEKLWLGVLWHHEYYDAVVVVEHGKKVHAYFTNDGVEHHVRAWIKGPEIKHETWVVEPEIQPYDGSVTCGFGNVGVLVEGAIARIVSVQEVEGVEWVIEREVGESVKVRFFAEAEEWIMEAWGNGETVVAECARVE